MNQNPPDNATAPRAVEQQQDCSAIVWLAARYTAPDATLYPNPLGDGWCCDLGIREAGILRYATASTKAEAAQKVAQIVATELGWPNAKSDL